MEYVYGKDVPMIRGDPERLKQVDGYLWNDLFCSQFGLIV